MFWTSKKNQANDPLTNARRADVRRYGRAKMTQDAVMLAGVREAALRAIWRLEQPGSPGDVNPHTSRMTPYALASMLTFSADGSEIHLGDVLARLEMMIFTGTPERREPRRDWTVWELERLGFTESARYLADRQLMGPR
ncbi:hypothetical protein ABZ656_37740 [Streptomyces sp. NPDC007095]|uniref:hypothetical protein n=1 Tax=Streptomyces sp. NPDC007095 TaxID=3154482 RepID=UPI0033DCC63C